MDQGKSLLQVVNLKIRHPGDLVTVKTDKRVSFISLISHFNGLESKCRPGFYKKARSSVIKWWSLEYNLESQA